MDLIYPGEVHERRIKINVEGNTPDLLGRCELACWMRVTHVLPGYSATQMVNNQTYGHNMPFQSLCSLAGSAWRWEWVHAAAEKEGFVMEMLTDP